jgi:hypothetical protein
MCVPVAIYYFGFPVFIDTLGSLDSFYLLFYNAIFISSCFKIKLWLNLKIKILMMLCRRLFYMHFSFQCLLRLPVWDCEVHVVLKKYHPQQHAGLYRETFHKSFASVLCILAWIYTYRHRSYTIDFYIVRYTRR